MDQQRSRSPANDIVSNATPIDTVPITVLQTQPITAPAGRPTRPALRTKRTYHLAQSFDDHAWHRGDSDDSDVERRRPRLKNRPTTKRLISKRLASIRDLSGDPEKQAEQTDPTVSRKDLGDDAPKQEAETTTASSDGKDESDDDEHLVTWTGPDDAQNPKNWSLGRKWAVVAIVSSFTFISAASSSIVAPTLPQMQKSLKFKTDIEMNMVMSIFVLASAIGPLLIGPLSEVYGRVLILQLSNIFFLIWNSACAWATSSPQMLVFRFLAGIGGSAPLAIGGAVLGDCFIAEERGKAISMYSIAPLLGPAIGPVVGGFVAESTTWRWVFRSTSIAGAVVQIVAFFFLQETYVPILLKRKAEDMRKSKGDDAYYTKYDDEEGQTMTQIVQHALVRPFIMLGTQPIIQAIAVYLAYLYGLLFLMLSTYSKLFIQKYGQPVNIGCLHYLSIGLGNLLGTQITSPINDLIYRRLKHRNGGVGRPEFRAPLGVVGSILMPIGLFIYGWSAHYMTHWIIPDFGAAFFAAGSIICFQSMQAYIVDSYTRYAASGLAATVVLRALTGFAFPLWAPYMFEKLHYGWGNSLLGFIGIIIGVPAPFIFWRYGERLRSKSRFAAE